MESPAHVHVGMAVLTRVRSIPVLVPVGLATLEFFYLKCWIDSSRILNYMDGLKRNIATTQWGRALEGGSLTGCST